MIKSIFLTFLKIKLKYNLKHLNLKLQIFIIELH